MSEVNQSNHSSIQPMIIVQPDNTRSEKVSLSKEQKVTDQLESMETSSPTPAVIEIRKNGCYIKSVLT